MATQQQSTFVYSKPGVAKSKLPTITEKINHNTLYRVPGNSIKFNFTSTLLNLQFLISHVWHGMFHAALTQMYPNVQNAMTTSWIHLVAQFVRLQTFKFKIQEVQHSTFFLFDVMYSQLSVYSSCTYAPPHTTLAHSSHRSSLITNALNILYKKHHRSNNKGHYQSKPNTNTAATTAIQLFVKPFFGCLRRATSIAKIFSVCQWISNTILIFVTIIQYFTLPKRNTLILNA